MLSIVTELCLLPQENQPVGTQFQLLHSWLPELSAQYDLAFVKHLVIL